MKDCIKNDLVRVSHDGKNWQNGLVLARQAELGVQALVFDSYGKYSRDWFQYFAPLPGFSSGLGALSLNEKISLLPSKRVA